MQKVQEINVYVILRAGEKVLMLKRFNGLWEFPGGGVDFGEHPRDSALRECEEETGIKPKNLKGPITVTSAVYDKNGIQKHSIYIVYEGEAEGESVRLSREHTAFAWLAPNELKNLSPIALNARDVLAHLLPSAHDLSDSEAEEQVNA